MLKEFIRISTEGNFNLYIKRGTVYKRYQIIDGYIRNTITGENMGMELDLVETHYDENGNYHEEILREPDCYEIVFK